MRTLKFFSFALALALVVVLQPTSAAPDSGPSASGNGNLTVGGELRTFSFTAVTRQDGSVSGQAQLYNRSAGNSLHIVIDCLTVVGTNAIVSGIVTNSNGPTDFTGWTGVFTVQDNGEGKNSPRDQISLVNLFPPPNTVDCDTFPFAAFSRAPIEGGNIQVKP